MSLHSLFSCTGTPIDYDSSQSISVKSLHCLLLTCCQLPHLTFVGRDSDVSNMGNAASFVKPPVKLISFSDFKKCGAFPRNPECDNMCVNFGSIDRSTSFVIYISHVWQRSYQGCPGWDGKPHPDHKTKKMFKLCVSGIDRIFKHMAPGMTKCYIWMDYGCVNQGNLALLPTALYKTCSLISHWNPLVCTCRLGHSPAVT